MLSELPDQPWGVNVLLEFDLNIKQLKQNDLISKTFFSQVV